ncbi:MFS transporter [Fervidobacterium sp.]
METLFPMMIIFSYSLVLNSMAPLLNSFRELYQISIALSTLLPFFSLTGTVLSNIFTGIYLNKLGLKRALLTGYTLTIVGSIIVAFSNNYYMAMLGLFIFGLSSGFGFTGSTTLLAQSKNANFGFYHGAYGLGGIIAPMCISLSTKLFNDFRKVYLLYVLLFIALGTYTLFRKIPQLQGMVEKLSLKGIKNAFKDKNFSTFLSLLILYSSAEIGIITWAGTVIKEGLLDVYLSYTLFWLVFTISRFATGFLEKTFKPLLKTNATILIFIVIGLFLLRHALFFVISGLFLGPLFPYMQKKGVLNVKKEHLTLFNGATYAFTSLGGNIASTIMGLAVSKSLIIAMLVPLTIMSAMEYISFKTGKVR